MRSYNANQLDLIASNPSLVWLFEIDKGKTGSVDYYYATNAVTYNAQAYTGCIIEHSGIKQMRPRTENRSVVCLDASFVISDAAYALTPGDLEDAYVTVRLIAYDDTHSYEEQMAVWKLVIKRAEASYGKITCHCVDFLQEVLEGSYPITEQVSTLYPSDVEDKTGLCVPVPIGIAYLPITSFYYDTDSTRYYMLGPSANTYTVYAVHSPASAPAEEWVDDGHSGDYDLEDTVATVDTDWKVLEPVIVDSDDDGTADAVGFWLDGDSFDYMCCRFSRNDTAILTNPANAIDYTLQVMGVASADIDTTAASGTYIGWSLTFNGGWVSPHSRAEVIADMLCECHSTLQITDQIELHVLSKTAQGAALTDSDLRDFRYSKVTRSANDSSYIAWQESGKPQDRFKKCLVAAKSATDNPSSDTFQIRFVQDSQDVQRIGSLRNQRRFLRYADVSFKGLFKLIQFQPGDVVAINDNAYGGSYDIMLDQVWIKPDGDIDFSGTRYSAALDDWSDLSPAVMSVATDSTTNKWYPVYAGPDSATGKYPNLLKGRVRVNENVILDPDDGITILDGGDLTVEDGGDIILNSVSGDTEADRGMIIFQCANYAAKLAGDYDDDSVGIYPDTTGKMEFYIGYQPWSDPSAVSQPFEKVYISATDYFFLYNLDGVKRSGLVGQKNDLSGYSKALLEAKYTSSQGSQVEVRDSGADDGNSFVSLRTHGIERVRVDYNGDTTFSDDVTFEDSITISTGYFDAITIYYVGYSNRFAVGVDYSDGYKYKISGSGALGTTDRLTIDSDGNVVIAQNLTVSGAVEVTGSATFTDIISHTKSVVAADINTDPGITLKNTNTDVGISTAILFENSHTSFSRYSVTLYGYLNALRASYTTDDWSTSELLLSISPGGGSITCSLLTLSGDLVVNDLKNIASTGGYNRKTSEAYADITADHTITITVSIPSNAKILGCQLRVDSALATGETWNAQYSGGATASIATAEAVAQNTKVNTIFDTNAATDITSSSTNITIQRSSDPGVDVFTAQGRIRAIVYYEYFSTMGDV